MVRLTSPRAIASFAAVLALNTLAPGQTQSPWRFWDSSDGFIESLTSSLAISPSGSVWAKHGSVGNIELLDGYSAPPYPDPGGSGKLECAPDGSLWIWSGKGLKLFENGKWRSFPLPEIVASGSMRGNSREEWDFTSYTPPYLEITISVVAVDRLHALFVLPDKILEFDAGTNALHTVINSAQAGMRRFTAIRHANDGAVYVTGAGGVGRLRPQDWRWDRLPQPPRAYVEFAQPVSVHAGELFVAGFTPTLTSAALRFDGTAWQELYRGQSRLLQAWPGEDRSVWIQDGNHLIELLDGRIHPVERSGALSGILLDVTVDHGGRFWVASSQGLSRYMPPVWRTPVGSPPLDDVVNSITEDKAGNIWFLSTEQLIELTGTKWTAYPLPKGETPWAIFTEGLAELPDGRIAIETTSPHLLTFDPARKRFTVVNHPAGRITRMFVKQPDGTLLVEVYPPGTKDVEIESFDGHRFRPFIGKDSLDGVTDLRSIVIDPGRKVWIGATNYFGVYENSKLRKITELEGFTETGAYYIFKGRAGQMFAGGRNGIYARNGAQWNRIQQGLDRVRSVMESRDGTMWIASGSGVHRYRAGVWITNGIEEGLPSSVAYKVFEDSRGRLWAGTTRGLSLYHSDADTDPPVVTLAGFDNPREAPPNGQVRLGFSGTDKWKFTLPARLLFSYRMDGGAWSPFTGANSASFEKLAGGKHVFEVRAMDRNGNISLASAIHRFSVLMPWYRTPQFLVLAALAAAIILILVFLAWTSYSHRGTLIQSLNQKNKLERDRQSILEMVARREPLPSILTCISTVLSENFPAAIPLVIWNCDGELQVFAPPSFPEKQRRFIRQIAHSGVLPPDWWRLVPAAAGDRYSVASPVGAVRSGDCIVGSIALLFEWCRHVPNTAEWLLETFSGLTAAAIENARLYERLAHQARHDVLTGLPNRLSFEDTLEASLQTAKTGNEGLAVLYLDLDRFKQINDSLGHHAGDLFLRDVARRLSDVIGNSAIARIGGDEFMLLLEHCDGKDAALGLARRLLDVLRAPVRIDGQDLFAGASIGISLFPADGNSPSALQKNADIAMYRAKAKGRNCVEFFSAEMGSKTAADLNVEQEIRKALDEQRLELFYQPQFTLDGKPTGMEALVRLRKPEGGYMSPAQFIPVAEESGLISAIGAWVLSQACRQIRQWLDEGLEVVRVSVNVSALEIGHESFAEDVGKVLAAFRLPPDVLELELTESAIVQNLAESTRQMQRLRAMGVRLAIDDFGTGYSSFAQLQNLPLDTLKIDRSFVKDLSAVVTRSTLVDTIVAMGRSLGLQVVAEGVETEAQLSVIRESKCDLIQGFLFCRPVPASEVRRFLLERKPALRALPRLEDSLVA